MDFNQFKEKWLGKAIDYDHTFSFTSVDLIQQYMYECYDVTGAVGCAIDYWNNPDSRILTSFSRVGGNDAKEGDIVVFFGLDGNPDGEIGIATGNTDSSNIEVLEQTTDDDTTLGSVRARLLSKNRAAGILRPIEVALPGELLPEPTTEEVPEVALEAAKFPQAPYTAPSSEQYEVVVDLPGYPTYTRAANRTDRNSDVSVGTYFVFSKDAGMINVTTIQGQPGAWINPGDNVLPPEPVEEIPGVVSEAEKEAIIEAWAHTNPQPKPDYRTTYKPFLDGNGEPTVRRYVAMKRTNFKDLEERLPDAILDDGREVNISGRFIKDDISYLRPKKMADQFLWFGIPEEVTSEPYLVPYTEFYNTKTTVEERIVMDTRHLSDYFVQFGQWASKKLKTNKG